MNDVEFKEANIIYCRMEEKLKECGKGKVEHYEEIEPEIERIYLSSIKAVTLKLQMDCRARFCLICACSSVVEERKFNPSLYGVF